MSLGAIAEKDGPNGFCYPVSMLITPSITKKEAYAKSSEYRGALFTAGLWVTPVALMAPEQQKKMKVPATNRSMPRV